MTSAYAEIRATIESCIAAEMAKSPSYPVSYQNVPFKPPNNSPWLQIVILFGDSTYATLVGPSAGFNKQNGTLTINVFTPSGIGAGNNFTIVERMKNLFHRQTISQIVFDAASGPSTVAANVIETGASAGSALASAYFQTQLTITFQAYVD